MLTLVSKFLIRIKYGDGLNAKGTLYDSWNNGYGFMETMQKFFLTKKTLHKYVSYSQVSKSPSKNVTFSWLPCRVSFIFLTLDLLHKTKSKISKASRRLGWVRQLSMFHLVISTSWWTFSASTQTWTTRFPPFQCYVQSKRQNYATGGRELKLHFYMMSFIGTFSLIWANIAP